MSDYTITTDFSPKDALPVNDPDKLILGSDLDVEFEAVQVAIATKYDSSDIATEAQAVAGVSNEVLITPLRLSQFVSGAGAGVVGDLIDLTDPGADRILFWDDSSNTVTWLTVGGGLQINTTTLSANVAGIDHDTLLNFVADEHIAHSSITLTAGEGLTGGGTIAANRSFALSISGLTEETTLDLANDVLAFYDASATAHRKIPLDDLLGKDLGDGKWYRSGSQATSAATEATVVYNAAEYDQLQRGSFSTSTGVYTAHATEASRIWIEACVQIAAIDDDDSIQIDIQKNGTDVLTHYFYNDTDNDSPTQSIRVGGTISLAATDTVRVRITTSSAESVNGGAALTYVSIVELA